MSYKTFVIIPVICAIVVLSISTYPIIAPILENYARYGQATNPCVTDPEKFRESGRNMDELLYHEVFDCYYVKSID